MTDMPATARFSLPLLATAQAQKEVTHNEALSFIDALLHPLIEGGPVAVPPASPEAGQCWLVAAGAGGAWAGRGGELAICTAGGWRFVAPRHGMRLVRRVDGAWLLYDGEDWVIPPSIAAPAGGATIDAEARSALAAVIHLLNAHGLLITG